jgi:hypothetical protein
MQEEQKHPMRICPTVVYIDGISFVVFQYSLR